MKIGSYVRLKHGLEEGYVIEIIDSKTVEIETTDGFQIPVLKADLVVVDKDESSLFEYDRDEIDDEEVIPSRSNDPVGIFIGQVADKEDGHQELYIINNTKQTLLYSIKAKSGTITFSGTHSGSVEAGKFQFLGKYQKKLSPIPRDIFIQIIFHSARESEIITPLSFQIQLRRQLSESKEETLPIIHAKGRLIEISSNKEEQSSSNLDIPEKVENIKEVDLHADAIMDNPEDLSGEFILFEQIKLFRNSLDQAIISGQSEITFIHGIGDGSLKKRIIKESAKWPQVWKIEDADSTKYGKGASTFKIKK